ncbi:hypothetical protein CISIN_1g0016361mg, partial [Citrus sinensis]
SKKRIICVAILHLGGQFEKFFNVQDVLLSIQCHLLLANLVSGQFIDFLIEQFYQDNGVNEIAYWWGSHSEGTGLLRLHSTYRHDLKIYSSDEGRVQMSAAAFAKGLLDLEGQLTPILVSLVSKDSSMLDGLDNASIEMEEAKARLNEIIKSGSKMIHSNGSSDCPWMADGVGLPPNASELLPKLVKLTKKVTEQVRQLAKDEDEDLAETNPYDVIPPYDQAKALGKTNIDVDRIAAGLPCGSEGFLLMYARWRKLERDLYNERKERFDITQIPDVYDSCK